MVKKSILVIFLNFVIVDRRASSTLENVLEFATGASHEPPMGFDPPAILRFWPDVRLKSATCSNCLFLPIFENRLESEIHYDNFKENMDEAILNSPCFGLA